MVKVRVSLYVYLLLIFTSFLLSLLLLPTYDPGSKMDTAYITMTISSDSVFITFEVSNFVYKHTACITCIKIKKNPEKYQAVSGIIIKNTLVL